MPRFQASVAATAMSTPSSSTEIPRWSKSSRKIRLSGFLKNAGGSGTLRRTLRFLIRGRGELHRNGPPIRKLAHAGFPPKKADAAAPLYMELPGGVMAQQSVLGFPIERVVPLTSYRDVEAITARMWRGEDLTVHYRYGIKAAPAPPSPPASSPRDVSAAKRHSAPCWMPCGRRIPPLSGFQFHRSCQKPLGISAGQRLGHLGTAESRFAVFLWDQHPQGPDHRIYTLLRLPKIQKAAAKTAAAAATYDFTGIAAVTLGNTLYSDFSGKTVKRDTADREWAAVLASLKEAKGRQLLSAACGYALPYADVVRRRRSIRAATRSRRPLSPSIRSPCMNSSP